MKKATSKKPSKTAAKSAHPAAKSGGQHIMHQKLLLAKRDELLAMVKHKDSEFSDGEIGDEADVASQTLEREMMFEMTNGERIILDDIEAALRRIEKGDFGSCESCRKKISAERLRAMPWARYCIQCQSRNESPGR